MNRGVSSYLRFGRNFQDEVGTFLKLYGTVNSPGLDSLLRYTILDYKFQPPNNKDPLTFLSDLYELQVLYI